MNQSHLSNHSSSNTPVVEFDIHGIVGIRLVDPPTKMVAALTRQLGHFRAGLDREADITVRFTPEITPPDLKYLGLDGAGFTDEAFFVFDNRAGVISAQIPFDTIGYHTEILCRQQRSTIPFLFEVIRLTLMRKNWIPLHASAFLYNGIGILAMGWTKGGKTETLLSFGNQGAHYVGDEWVIVSGDGCEMFGLPVPVTIWEWQFEHVPNLLPEINFQQRLFFKGIHLLESTHKMMAHGRLKRTLPVEMLGEGMPLIKRRLRIKAKPQEIFGERCHQSKASLDKLFLMVGHQDASIRVKPCDGAMLAQCMVHSNVAEQMHLFETYKAFRFAFPERGNPLMEEFEVRQLSLLQKAFTDKEAYQVLHPYPVSFQELFDHMQPYCQDKYIERDYSGSQEGTEGTQFPGKQAE